MFFLSLTASVPHVNGIVLPKIVSQISYMLCFQNEPSVRPLSKKFNSFFFQILETETKYSFRRSLSAETTENMAAIGDMFEIRRLPSKHNSKCKCHALNSFKCEEISSYSCDGDNMFLPDDSQIRFVKKYMLLPKIFWGVCKYHSQVIKIKWTSRKHG